MSSTKSYVSLAAGLAIALLPTAAFAGAIVRAELWDKGADVEMPTNLAYPVSSADLSKATMGIKLSRDSAPAGKVTFQVKNISKDTVHEMIVMYLENPGKALPYIANENRVDEDKAGDKGEVSELEAGKSGSLTIELKPGRYLLICNVPGHYAAGMWKEFEVSSK